MECFSLSALKQIEQILFSYESSYDPKIPPFCIKYGKDYYFYEIKEMYPRYLFVSDLILQKNIDGINNVNIVDFIYNNNNLK